MASPVVEELVNTARRELTVKSAADRLVNSARPLLRQAMEQRASAAEAKARAASPATRAPVSSPEVETIDPVVPQQGMVEDSPQSLRSGPMVPQAQLQQQQRIFGGQRGVENALMRGDQEALDIEDNMAEASMRASYARQLDDGTGERRSQYAEASSSFDERGVFVSPEDQRIRFEIDDTMSRIRPEYLRDVRNSAPLKGINQPHPVDEIKVLPDRDSDITNLKLGDIFQHDELDRFYPQYKDIKIARVPEDSNNQGTFDPRTNTLSIRSSYGDEEQLRTTIIHELQHYVQREEGFARGGSLNEFIRPEDLDGFPTITARYQALDTKLEQLGLMNKNNPGNKAIRSAINDTLAEKALVDKIRREAYDNYRRFTGEKEAFDTERRLRMSPVEKAINQPALADREFMDDAITLGQGETLRGNIVPGMSFENDHIVFHGGPTSAIDKFMLKYIGTGEGAIMRGWGFYFAERPGVSAGYRAGRARDKKIKTGREAVFEINPTIWDKNTPGGLKAAQEKISDLILEQARVTDTLNSSLGGKTTTTFQDILSSKTSLLGLYTGVTRSSNYNSISSWIADSITTFAYNGKVRRVSSIENLAEKISDSIRDNGTKNLEALGQAQALHSRFDEYLNDEFDLVIKNIEEGLTDKQFRSLLEDGVLTESFLSNALVNGFRNLEHRTRNVLGVIVGEAKQEIALSSEFRFFAFGHREPYTKEEMLAYTRGFKQALVNASNAAENWFEEEIQTLNRLFSPDYEFDLDSVIEVAIKNEDFFKFELAGSPSVKDDAGLFVLDLKANKDKDYLHLDKPMREQSPKIKRILEANIKGPSISWNEDAEGYVKYLEGGIWERMSESGGVDPKGLAKFTEQGIAGIKKAYRTVMDTDQGNGFRWTNRKFAALVLKEWGIPGSAHWDTFSRDPGMPERKRTNNFVIWDEDIIEQLAVQPHSWADRGKLEVDPADHPLTDEYQPQ